MPEPVFRPAREITIAVRRVASHDPANFDSSGSADPADQCAEMLERTAARPGPPMWPYALAAVLLLGGCALTWFGQMPVWGTVALAGVALVVMVRPVLLGGYRGRHRGTESGDERARQS